MVTRASLSLQDRCTPLLPATRGRASRLRGSRRRSTSTPHRACTHPVSCARHAALRRRVRRDAVIPEFAPGSPPWRATSSGALTGALPALLALHGTVALDRRARAELTTAWLRLMTVRRVACDAVCLVCAGLGNEGPPVWSGLGGGTGGDVPAVCVRGSPPTGRDTPSHPVDHSRVGRLLVLASLPSRRSSMGCAASP